MSDDHLRNEALEALSWVRMIGLSNVRGGAFADDLNYGINQEIYSQTEVDQAQEEYLKHTALEALGMVSGMGIDRVQKNESWAEGLKYGIENQMFSQTEIDQAQEQYPKNNALEALRLVETSGVNHIQNDENYAGGLEYGIKQEIYSQTAVDRAQQEYLKKLALNALEAVEEGGLEYVSEDKDWSEGLEHGLKKEIISQTAVNQAEEKYQKKNALSALETVRTNGIRIINENPGDDWCMETYAKGLKYGLEKGIFSQTDIDKAQEEFLTKNASETLKMIERLGMETIRHDEYMNESLAYGLEKGIISQADIDKAQEKYWEDPFKAEREHEELLKNLPSITEEIEMGMVFDSLNDLLDNLTKDSENLPFPIEEIEGENLFYSSDDLLDDFEEF